MKKNKKYTLILLFFIILFCCLIQTMVYSAINSTMNIKGVAYARVEADVRITGFRLANAINATSFYEEFGKNHVVTNVNLTNSTSNITYYLEITNYGNVDVGISNITGLPEGISYSIKDYNLKDKICDDSGKCNNFAVKTYEITLSTTGAYEGNIQMNFEFKNFYSIVYSGITNKNYISSIMNGEDLNVTFTSDIPNRINIYVDDIEIDRSTYVYDNTTGNLIFQNVSGNITIEKAQSTLLDGQSFSVQLKNFVNGTTDATYKSEDNIITYIGFYEDVIPEGYIKTDLLNLPSLNVSDNGRIKAYNDDGKIYIYSVDDILANESMYSMFREFKKLEKVDLLCLDTRNVTNMASLFNGTSSLESLDLSNFDTSKVKNMSCMFKNLPLLTNIDISNFDTSLSERFDEMFMGDSNLSSLDLSNFDSKNATMIYGMFDGCTSLVSVDLSGFVTSKVDGLHRMFNNCTSLKEVDLSSFDTSMVKQTHNMFMQCTSLEKIYVGDGWNMDSVTTSINMFAGASLLPNYDPNYKDVTKAYAGDGGYLTKINKFYVDDVAYMCEDNMTWEEWINSEYNVDNFKKSTAWNYMSKNGENPGYFIKVVDGQCINYYSGIIDVAINYTLEYGYKEFNGGSAD